MLKDIEAACRAATPGEQSILARWSGWGAVPAVFDPGRPGHDQDRATLARLLSPAERAAAARNTLNAHYTDAAIASAIWNAVTGLGFAGGRVLEPGCGSGIFIGLAPPGAQMTGVELDPVTAAIAATLYPQATILAESFADTAVPDGMFDAAIGNVPFGDVSLHDATHNPGGHSIHNHFIIKALRLTRPGGIAALITSRYTMDARNPAARREIAGLADLIGAVRLPSSAHQRAAGTAVVTDLLILRRREPGRGPDGPPWEHARLIHLGGQQVAVNTLFTEHPDMVLGTMRPAVASFGAGDLAVDPAGDTITGLTRALREITERARASGQGWAPVGQGAVTTQAAVTLVADRDRFPDGYLRALQDGTLTQVAGGTEAPYPVPASQAAELRQLLGLRDTVRELLDAEASTADDTPELGRLRAVLGRRYDAYVRRYGPVSRFSWRRTGRTDPATGQERRARVRPPQGGFRTDPYAPAVLALEHFDAATQTAVKAAIFTRRVIAPRSPRVTASSPADALAICTDLYGQPRIDVIARLLGTSPGEARAGLGTLVFDDPGTGALQTAAEYLSGRVRAKLTAAEAAALDDRRYEANVTALRAAIPPDLGPGEIEARLGASWINASYIRVFLAELLDDDTIRVEHPGGQLWGVRGGRHSVLATRTWGTPECPAPQIAQHVLEQRRIQIRRQVSEDTWVPDPDATLAAQEKAAEMAARFADWAWEEPSRAADLAAAYNAMFNSLVLRSYDNAELSLPGLALDFEPRSHQVAAVARIIAEPSVLLAHEVGAGKTAEMVMGCMELRRLGLARKPAIVVPNHMLDQFGREFGQLYPQARILIAHREDLQGERRRVLLGRAATGDWDAIIVSRSAFEHIPMSRTAQRDYLQQEAAKIRDWMAIARKSEGSLTVKRLEKAVLRAEERVKKLLASPRRDAGITFEQTGIDYLFIDEAHAYKNLRTVSVIADASIAGSSRATDLDMKISYLRERNGSRVATFATATPIANSITEAHVMQRYLRPDILADAGVAEFDSWAATFGEQVTAVELAPEGGPAFRQKTRFAKFVNVPEMLRLWHVSADIKTAEDLTLPVPELAARPADGQRLPETAVIEPTAELVSYVAGLGERAEAIRARQVQPEDDNMLKVSTDGRKAALDMRLAGVPMTGPGKIDAAAARITRIWRDQRHGTYPLRGGGMSPVPGALQIVFCDLGTPGADGRWNVYDALRDRLTRLGMPGAAIRYMHDAATDQAKAELFEACRNGIVAVLIGSTEKMGVGTNVQDRAVALHHLDCPWRPADVAQREGRILRQGNHNPEVQIIRYATERSFDGYMWQAVERKSRFIGQVMRGRLDVREIEDIGDSTLSFAEVKALATGNPLLVEKAETDAQLAKLTRAERAHHRNQDALARTITACEQRIEALTALCEQLTHAITRRANTRGDAFTMTLEDTRHVSRTDAGLHLIRHLTGQLASLAGGGHAQIVSRPGHLGGFGLTITTSRLLGTTETLIAFDEAPGIDLRLTLADISAADPAKLAVRLENRIASIETQLARHQADIGRLRTEAGHARATRGTPFPQTLQLARTRQRHDEIEQQLREAAGETSQPASPPERAAGCGQASQLVGTTLQQLTRASFPATNPLAGSAQLSASASPQLRPALITDPRPRSP